MSVSSRTDCPAAWVPILLHPSAQVLSSLSLSPSLVTGTAACQASAGHLTGPVSLDSHKQLYRKARNFSPFKDGETEAPRGCPRPGQAEGSPGAVLRAYLLTSGTQELAQSRAQRFLKECGVVLSVEGKRSEAPSALLMLPWRTGSDAECGGTVGPVVGPLWLPWCSPEPLCQLLWEQSCPGPLRLLGP